MTNRNLANDAENPDMSSVSASDAFIMRTSGLLKEMAYSVLKAALDLLYAPIAYVAYALYAYGNAFSPADATTYYFGSSFTDSPTTTAATRRVYIPKAGTITRVDLSVHNGGGTVGSNETFTMLLRLNNTTDTPLSSNIQANAASGGTNFYNITGLSIAVVAGDYIEIKWVTPTWATNPTLVYVEAQVFVN